MGQVYSLLLGRYSGRFILYHSVGIGQVYSLHLGGYRVRLKISRSVKLENEKFIIPEAYLT